MREKNRLALLLGITGFFGALLATVSLWFFVGAYAPVVLGFRHLWVYLIFPFVGAVSAGGWSLLFKPRLFGASHGALVAILTFFTVCAFVSSFGAGLSGFLAYAMFGFILFGWLGVIAGAAVGHYFHRTIENRAR